MARAFILRGISSLLVWTLAAAPSTAQTCTTLLPQSTAGHSFAYDTARGRSVLFGGGATWEFDGTQWTRQRTAVTPPARISAGMVYDSVRGRCVLFGGQGGYLMLGDTWEYDGTSWTQVAMSGGPAARYAHGMAFDPARGKTVLFGGYDLPNSTVFQDTWEYDGLQWVQASPVHSPTPRYAVAMAGGPQGTVLFGGRSQFVIASSPETWLYDGVDWQLKAPTTMPTPRFGAQLSFDQVHGRFVLVAGNTILGISLVNLGDAWAFDGTNWVQLATNAITARNGHAMTFDAAHGTLLLLGGGSEPHQLLSSSTGASWTPVTSVQPPPSRENFGLAYDTRRECTVLFGGSQTNGTALSNETWELHSTQWNRATPAHAPSARSGAAMAYDERHGRIVLFGGDAGAPLFDDTWEYNGVDWQQRPFTISPPMRTKAAIAYDVERDTFVLASGTNYQAHLLDTWELRPSGWVQTVANHSFPFGTNCSMAYDRQRQRTLLVAGGSYPSTYDYSGADWTLATFSAWSYQIQGIAYDAARGRTIALPDANAYSFDGQTWTPEPLQEAPSLTFARSVYDAARARVVRVNSTGETAIYEPAPAAAWTQLGSGCAGSAGVPHLDAAPPALGTTMQVQMSNLPAGTLAHVGAGFYATQWQGLPLPLDLSTLGFSGCTLWIDSVPAFGTWHVASGGVVTRTLQIPSSTDFAGLRIFFQGSVLDPSVAGDLVFSDAGVGTLH